MCSRYIDQLHCLGASDPFQPAGALWHNNFNFSISQFFLSVVTFFLAVCVSIFQFFGKVTFFCCSCVSISQFLGCNISATSFPHRNCSLLKNAKTNKDVFQTTVLLVCCFSVQCYVNCSEFDYVEATIKSKHKELFTNNLQDES